MIVLRSALFAAALLLVTPPFAVLSVLTFPLSRMGRFRVISWWSKIMLFVARVVCRLDYEVEGRENLPSRPCVILSKHQSAWETLAFQTVFPPQVHVLKRELLWIPFFGWGLGMMSPIAINRAKGRAALRQLARLGKERILQGFWVVIFPEGTRVAPGTKRKYQPGGAWLAVQTGAPVVPVAHNAGLYWPKNAFLKFPGTITMRIGPAIPTEGRDPADVIADTERWIEQQQAEICPARSN
ncbi:MAG: 1-acyl-sn-glycerol-3-phosphate acyltransferase [Proteobacteria bacterium]|nr:1-acyl-sn-glycerol-3-phosphate acyltransferase [Pseudomonadota bacterium]